MRDSRLQAAGCGLAWAGLIWLVGSVAHAEDPGTFRGRVQAAIDRGVRYLKSVQRDDGSWPAESVFRFGGRPTIGPTVLALQALAEAGADREDGAVRRALHWVRAHPEELPDWAYGSTQLHARLLRTLVLLDPPGQRESIDRLPARILEGERVAGGWHMQLAPPPSGPRQGGRSATHGALWPTFEAVLALRTADLHGSVDVPAAVWRRTLRWQEQNRFSGFGREVAALGTTVAAAAQLRRPVDADRIEDAFLRLEGRDFDRVLRTYWYLYCLDRLDRILELGSDGWYGRGAEHLLPLQAADGSFRTAEGPRLREESWIREEQESPLYRTAIAVMFLSRARAITPGARFPDLAPGPDDLAQRLAAAFDLYVRYLPVRRVLAVRRFRKAGPAAVDFLLDRLDEPSLDVRRAADELLRRLVKPPVRFRPAASPERRVGSLRDLRDWWREARPE